MTSLMTAVFVLSGFLSLAWAQGETYKAPIPKPSAQQAPAKEPEKSAAPAAPAKKAGSLDFEFG
jgi:hypothetical protein